MKTKQNYFLIPTKFYKKLQQFLLRENWENDVHVKFTSSCEVNNLCYRTIEIFTPPINHL